MHKLSSDKIDLPIEVADESRHNWMASSRYPAIPPSPDFEPEAPAVPLSHYVWILRRHLWKMAAFVATCTLVTFIVLSLIHISEPTRQAEISYAVFCLKK